MKETWRWFGPQDDITIPEIVQTGAAGVVSALHNAPPGAVWSVDAIEERQAQIAWDGSGLTWDVVESLPVSEVIKTQGPDMSAHLDSYRTSLENLAACGVRVICYNFMPVLDWTRTELRRRLPNGGTTMAFDLADFAAFDLFELRRAGAEDDYPEALRVEAQQRHMAMEDDERAALADNIVAGLPGAAEHWTIADVAACLATYDGIDADRLRANLVDFLSEVVPTAERLGLRLCCHPDDPPFPLLGLPRVMSSVEDYETVLGAVDSPANGATLCTGSLGVSAAFDAVDFVRRLGPKIHFVHLRNTRRDEPSAGEMVSFHEAEHLDGDTDMVATIRALISEERHRRDEARADWQIPMRPDHGQSLLSDLDRPLMPGYPLIGRMRGLAELRGIMAALSAES